MTKETMTIHKALSELKILDDRIESAINSANYVTFKKVSATKVNGVNVEEWKQNVESAYVKATDLIKRRNALKRAVVLSNAVTKVSINGVEYTVAEAIEMKNHGIEFDEMLMNKLAKDYNEALYKTNFFNGDDLEKRTERFIDSMYSSKEKVDSAEVNKTREEFIKANTYEVLDPLKGKELIENLDDLINSFKAEVDSALSVSNAITMIEIEY